MLPGLVCSSVGPIVARATSWVRFSLGVGRAGVSIGSRWTSGSLIARFCVWSPLRDLRGSRFLERLDFSDEFGQGIDAFLLCQLYMGTLGKIRFVVILPKVLSA